MSYENLLDASFKGVSFYVATEELTAFGRRIVNHEYPNTSEQYSEDTGGFPEVFSITGFVIGDDAKDQLNSFINACNEEGSGKLVMPFFGERIVKAGEGNVSVEPYVNVEKIGFTVTFHTSRDEAGFVEAEPNSLSVLGLGESAIDVFSDIFGGSFGFSLDVFSQAVKIFDLTTALNVIKGLTKFVSGTELGSILRAIDNIAGDLGSLIRNGPLLGDRMKALMNSLFTGLIGANTSNLINSLIAESKTFESKLPISATDINQGNAGFYPINNWPETTENRIERNEQRDLTEAYIRMLLLALAYATLGTGNFDTEEELDEVKNNLEDEYLNLMHGIVGIENGNRLQVNTKTSSSFVANKDVWTAFQNLRIGSLLASERDDIVNYKIDTGYVRQFGGTSVLNAAYLSQAESIKNEDDLLNLSRVMYNVNNREAYALTGQIKVLKRVSI